MNIRCCFYIWTSTFSFLHHLSMFYVKDQVFLQLLWVDYRALLSACTLIIVFSFLEPSGKLSAYHGYLASSYHTGIISGFTLISSYLENVASAGKMVRILCSGGMSQCVCFKKIKIDGRCEVKIWLLHKAVGYDFFVTIFSLFEGFMICFLLICLVLLSPFPG